MEMIHGRSYTHIIRMYIQIHQKSFLMIKILARAQSVTKAYDEFINYAHEYDQSNMWKKVGRLSNI